MSLNTNLGHTGGPLCLTHRVTMAADQETTGSISYACPDCDLNWERRLGYFKTATKTETFQFGIGGKRCPEPDHYFLYLAEVSADGTRSTFRCAIDGCKHMKCQ
jgi:hypothetical protein